MRGICVIREIRLPREMFTPLNVKPIHWGEAYLSGPVKIFTFPSGA